MDLKLTNVLLLLFIVDIHGWISAKLSISHFSIAQGIRRETI